MQIKKELVIDVSVSRVYDAITDIKQLSQWFPDVVSLEPEIDGKIVFRFPNASSDDSDAIEGKITELEKNKKLSYTWSHPDVPDFPLTKVSWNLEQIGKNKTRVTIVHSGFVDEDIMGSYDRRWMRIAEHLNVFAVSKKPANTQKQTVPTVIPIPLCLAVVVALGTLQNNDSFASGFFWLSLLATSLASIPFINRYKKFSWMDKPLVTAVGITVLAQIVVTVYWGIMSSNVSMPLAERLAIDAVLFYPLMVSLLPIGFGVSYAAIRFGGKSKTIQNKGLVAIQVSEAKANGLLVGLVAFQALLNVLVYNLVTL